jgi:hypothetical protein
VTGPSDPEIVAIIDPEPRGKATISGPPGQVVIAVSTRRLTGGLFDYEDLRAVEIRGLAIARADSRADRRL